MSKMRGSEKETGQLIPVECTYPDCIKRFATQEEMKKHKKAEPAHDYCKKCDVDCEDWESMLFHKVDSMAPWLEGTKKHEAKSTGVRDENGDFKTEQPKHIVCEFCGEDFKSFGGRKIHRSREHPAAQSINCPGYNAVPKACSAHFVRAAQLVAHLEEGRCCVIPAREFKAAIRHRHFLEEVMKAPHEFAMKLAINKEQLAPPAAALPAPSWLAKSIKSTRSTTSTRTTSDLDGGCPDDEGGVALGPLDQEDPGQRDGHAPLEPSQPEADLMSFEGAEEGGVSLTGIFRTRAELETWPRLPGVQSSYSRSDIVDDMSYMSFNSRTPSMSGTEISETEFSDVTSRRGGLRVPTEANSYLDYSEQDDASVTSGTILQGESAWSKRNSSAMLLKGRKEKAAWEVKPGDWSGHVAQQENDGEADRENNMMYTHWHDPGSKDYDLNNFKASHFEPMLNNRGELMYDRKTRQPVGAWIVQFCCPFPSCEDAKFSTPQEFEIHWAYGHNNIQYRCPSCLKLYEKVASLTAHCESGGKCNAQYGEQYKKFISDITGGLLTTQRHLEPKIFRREQALVKAGRPVCGLLPVEYKAKMPGENQQAPVEIEDEAEAAPWH